MLLTYRPAGLQRVNFLSRASIPGGELVTYKLNCNDAPKAFFVPAGLAGQLQFELATAPAPSPNQS